MTLSMPLILALLFSFGSPASTAVARALSPAHSWMFPAQGASQEKASTTWTLVSNDSEARYRVREQLAGIDFPSDAVGTTTSVSGRIVVADDGTIDTQTSQFRVDLTTLATDNDRRDNYVRRRTLEVEQYPEATLIPLRFIGLDFPLASSGSSTFQLETDLNLHGVTRTTVWEVKADFSPDTIKGVATTSFPFASFDLDVPSVARVLSVDETIRLELEFVLARQES